MVYTVMELVRAREMFEVIQRLGQYSESIASKIFRQILKLSATFTKMESATVTLSQTIYLLQRMVSVSKSLISMFPNFR